MINMGMEDLDELVTKCRGESGREYIREAVACYHAGAYRSAIVATWQAVFFDILYKYKELDLTGDTAAKKEITSFHNNLQSKNLRNLLNFERDILTNAKDQFSLLTENEIIDLKRLQDDRHRCAHPSMNDIDTIYHPSPELARTHIKNAIDILLSREPVQGKSVIENILQTIKSEYFPKNIEEASTYLSSGYLKRAKKSVVQNIVIQLIKECFVETTKHSQAKKFSIALHIIHSMYTLYTENILKSKLSSILSGIGDENIYKLLIINYHFKTIWIYTDESFKIKIKELVRNYKNEKNIFPIYLSLFLDDDSIVSAAHESISDFSDSQMEDILKYKHAPSKLYHNHMDTFLNKTINSSSFRIAEYNIEKFILPFSEYISENQLTSFLKSAIDNDQIFSAGKVPSLLSELFTKTTSEKQLVTVWSSFKDKITEEHRNYGELKKQIEAFNA